MIIGLPKALLYYEDGVLWENFFENLGFSTITSRDTNKEIIEFGNKYSIDESCLASKIFMGHVYSLIGKCDYVFIPRFCSFSDTDVTCVKFNALYDICKNVFKDTNIRILKYDMDVQKNKKEINGFLEIGRKLEINRIKTLLAYFKAKKEYLKDRQIKHINQRESAGKTGYNTDGDPNKINILLVSHPYIYKDKFMGSTVTDYLKNNGVNLIYADIYDTKNGSKGWLNYTNSIYWKYSKDLLNGLYENASRVDGIVFLTVFPCGLDSLVYEICKNKLGQKAVLSLVIDELDSNTGLLTRLESFLDILNIKKVEGSQIVI